MIDVVPDEMIHDPTAAAGPVNLIHRGPALVVIRTTATTRSGMCTTSRTMCARGVKSSDPESSKVNRSVIAALFATIPRIRPVKGPAGIRCFVLRSRGVPPTP